MQLSESEPVAMYLAQQVAEFEGTPFLPRLKTVFRKVLALFGGKLSFDPALLDECFSFDELGPHARFRPEHLDQRPAGYHARADLEKAFGMYINEETEQVVLEFAPEAAKRVAERRWPRTWKLKTLGSGRLEMSMKVGLSLGVRCSSLWIIKIPHGTAG